MNTAKTAIVPLNLKALRVAYEDSANLTKDFAGRSSLFETLPYNNHTGNPANNGLTFTGDQIERPLEQGAKEKLGAGIHLHWELPDFFRRAVQSTDGGELKFPHVPNRWLVIRYASFRGPDATDDVQTSLWVVESDYLHPETPNRPTTATSPDMGISAPSVSIPLPNNPSQRGEGDQPPYRFMARVLPYDSWISRDKSSEYLGDTDDNYLTSIGFSGPTSSSFYPDCFGVFGFHDELGDLYPDEDDERSVQDLIAKNLPVNLRVSYQVIGWVSDDQNDPMNGFADDLIKQYNQMLADYKSEGLSVGENAFADFFTASAAREFGWVFNAQNVDFASGETNAPAQTLCSGILQEVVFDMATNDSFLKKETSDSAVKVSVGSSSVDALSVLLASEMAEDETDEATKKEVQEQYEYLLDMLQLGQLARLEQNEAGLFELDEELHAHGFARRAGGSLFTINSEEEETKDDANASEDAPAYASIPAALLPSELVAPLDALNQAMKAYEQGRSQLVTSRQQLFMDWFRYAQIRSNQNSTTDVSNFLRTSDSGEIDIVREQGARVGLLMADAAGNPSADKASSLASAVAEQFILVKEQLDNFPNFTLKTEAAPSFHTAADPVLMLQGEHMEPVRRNGNAAQITCRLDDEIITKLVFGADADAVSRADIQGLPKFDAAEQPYSDVVEQLIVEGHFLIPMLAGKVAAAAGKGADFSEQLNFAQGGASMLEASDNPENITLFSQAHGDEAPLENPKITGGDIEFTFTNSLGNAWTPNAAGWERQEVITGPDGDRADPFLPISLLWCVSFEPLCNHDAEGRIVYSEDALTASYEWDEDAIDYRLSEGPSPFSGAFLSFKGEIFLAQKSTYNLADQIKYFQQNYPDDTSATDEQWDEIIELYQDKNILAQALSGFSSAQVQRRSLPQLPITTLVASENNDKVTRDVRRAIDAAPSDDWYADYFNGEMPVKDAENFGPLRAGNLKISKVELVDVFGQRLKIGVSDVVPAITVHDPSKGEKDVFLPPRLTIPARLWSRWLSANGPGDVEMNPQPVTSPICGWVMPNHLEASLFFYDADGSQIGSLGIEAHQLVYRTRPSNALENPTDNMGKDIDLKVNPHLVDFMNFLTGGKTPSSRFTSVLSSLTNSENFIRPGAGDARADLSVLVGRPLALTRAVLNLETLGGVLPTRQDDTQFKADIEADDASYEHRMKMGSADIGSVRFPIKLGDLAKSNDGLVGFLIGGETEGSYQEMYSPFAPTTQGSDVINPDAVGDPVQLTLNGEQITVTFLHDPRVPLHLTSGVLPIETMRIPPALFEQQRRELAMTFFTNPVLREKTGRLTVALPEENGFEWSWIEWQKQNNALSVNVTPLQAQAINGVARAGYSAQSLREGWLELTQKAKDEPEK